MIREESSRESRGLTMKTTLFLWLPFRLARHKPLKLIQLPFQLPRNFKKFFWINDKIELYKIMSFSLVIGLSMVAFFLILVGYVIYKVHWKKENHVKRSPSKIFPTTLEEEPAADGRPSSIPTVASNLSNIWRHVSPHQTGDIRISPSSPQYVKVSFKYLKTFSC